MSRQPGFYVADNDVDAIALHEQHAQEPARKPVPRTFPQDNINNNNITNISPDTKRSSQTNIGQPTDSQHGRVVDNQSAVDAQSQPRSPPQRQRLRTRTASDGGSLNGQVRRFSLNEPKHGNQSSSQTQRSSLSHKRNGDEMQGSMPLSQSHPRPAKQLFSPSSSRGGHTPFIETSNPTIRDQRHPAELLSSTTPSPEVNHPYHKIDLSYDPSRTSEASPTLSSQSGPRESQMVRELPTRPITEQQLINEVKGIYAGLVMVEKKCVEIVAQQTKTNKALSDQQWKALVALHRTLLQEHHDFFSASQHPAASETLKKLAIKYAMPARMWRNGIHSFLELLRHNLPHSMEHMLSFIYLAYSMIALLKESVPSFVETWIECLGDLARYRMAIEDTDPRDRETWSNVAKMWYHEAADKSPNVGRIQHHLAVLARPNIVEQLYSYDNALVSVVPFINARESIMLLFDIFLKNGDTVRARYPPAEFAFVNFNALLFTRRAPAECFNMLDIFRDSFGKHMDRAGPKFRMQGPQMAASLFASLMDFGKEDSRIWNLYCHRLEDVEKRKQLQEGQSEKATFSESVFARNVQQEFWTSLKFEIPVEHIPLPTQIRPQEPLPNSTAVVSVAAPLVFESITLVASRVGDKNGVPFMHVVLAILYDFSFVPDALTYVEACIPWTVIMLFLNTIGRSGVSYANVEADTFVPSHGGHGRQLPEDFLMRGMMSTRHYYESDFFSGPLVDDDERSIELPSHQAPRTERCLWLGVRLAKLGRYLSYDYGRKMFETTEFARSLATNYIESKEKVYVPQQQ